MTQEIGNSAWSFAVIALQDTPLMQSISSAALNRINEFGLQGLANTAWAFSTLILNDTPLIHAISAQALRRI